MEHMTSAHENLENLSKRVESQELPGPTASSVATMKTLQQRKTTGAAGSEITVQKFIPIAPHKKALPRQSPSLQSPTATVVAQQQPPDNYRHPPPGFKMSYALAYVPVFVPDRPEDEGGEEAAERT